MGILYITECTQLMPAGAPGGLGRVPQEPPLAEPFARVSFWYWPLSDITGPSFDRRWSLLTHHNAIKLDNANVFYPIGGFHVVLLPDREKACDRDSTTSGRSVLWRIDS